MLIWPYKLQESSGQELFGPVKIHLVKSMANHGHAKMIVDNNDNECFHDQSYVKPL